MKSKKRGTLASTQREGALTQTIPNHFFCSKGNILSVNSFYKKRRALSRALQNCFLKKLSLKKLSLKKLFLKKIIILIIVYEFQL